MATVKEQNDFKNLFLKSLVVGFILVSTWQHDIVAASEIHINLFLFLPYCCVLAFVVAQFYVSEIFSKIRKKLHIRRTVNESIWNDIQDKSETLWVRVINYKNDIEYLGILAMIEDFQRNPIIVLTRYTERNFSTREEIHDYTNDPTRRVLIDTAKYDRIELIYDKKSKKITEK
ncbi:hypothetical protein [Caproiciproducens sp.]